jgi:hypothetical protein
LSEPPQLGGVGEERAVAELAEEDLEHAVLGYGDVVVLDQGQ